MKNYYKILGVKEKATEEEIRERWVKLTKDYHPDRSVDMASDERIKEINEAYQILKHSSTRLEYDLKRTYGQKKREGERRIYLTISLIFLMSVGILYFRNAQPPPQQTVPGQIDPFTQSRYTHSGDVESIIQPTFQRESKDPINPVTQRLKNLTKGMTPRGDSPIDLMTQQIQPSREAINPEAPSIAMVSTTEKAEPVQPLDSMSPTTSTNLTIQAPFGNPMAQNLMDPISSSPNMKGLIDREAPEAKLQPPQSNPLPPLASEEEVRTFFDRYIERYNRKDIEGFLSFFSSKAIQNQKDGLEGIRRIYTNFFNQGKEIRLRTEGIKIDASQNTVEVKARYEIEQILKAGGEKKVWRGQICWGLVSENGGLKIISLDYQHQ